MNKRLGGPSDDVGVFRKRYLLLLSVIEPRMIQPVASVLTKLSGLSLFVHTQCCVTLDNLIITFFPVHKEEILIRQRERERERERGNSSG